MDGILTDTTTQDQSGNDSNDNERVLFIPRSNITGDSPELFGKYANQEMLKWSKNEQLEF